MRGIRFGVVQSAVTQALTLLGWGDAASGLLGNGTGTTSAGFQTVLLTGALEGKTIAQVATGRDHSLFLTTDGMLVAMGRNDAGQLGDGTTNASSTPVLVDTSESSALHGKTIKSIAVGGDFTTGASFAVCSDGTVAGWGSGNNYLLGSGGGSLTPRSLMTGSLVGQTVVKVVSGQMMTAFLTNAGAAHACGSGLSGMSDPVSIMTGALTDKTVKQLSIGTYNLLALCTDGTVAGLGTNGYGQLGDGSSTERSTPVSLVQDGVLAGKTIIQIAASLWSGWALCSDGYVAGWGVGKIGDGLDEMHTSPVAVTGHGVLTGGVKPVEIQAGQSTCWLRTSTGALLGCGDSDRYQLVVDTTNQLEFVQIVLPDGATVARLGNTSGVAKSCHAFVAYAAA